MAAEERSKEQRVTSRDIPRLLDTLACDDPNARAETLTLLCPCRNVRYDKEVWLAIFQAAKCADSHVVRDRAGHAIGTLRERARTDPRSQALVSWLVDQGVAPSDMSEAIPAWRPYRAPELNGLIIPRYEPPSRSRKNRRKRK
jgi:hypothetical protein